MSVLIKVKSKYDLSKQSAEKLTKKIVSALKGRVAAAYLFGSFATGKTKSHSDIDLIIIKDTNQRFTERALEFQDLFDIFPNFDILVYTQAEFDKKLQEPLGFGKSVKQQLKKIL